jgi:hypothetical protein
MSSSGLKAKFSNPFKGHGASETKLKQMKTDKAVFKTTLRDKLLKDLQVPGAFVLNPRVISTDGDGATVFKPEKFPVLIDPFLCKQLRPHQKEGVQFLWKCLTGNTNAPIPGGGRGAILADEMGLGKTLTVISTMWTLLRQGEHGKADITQAIIVTPASLVQNWACEFKKWLGSERLLPVVIESSAPNALKEMKIKVRETREWTRGRYFWLFPPSLPPISILQFPNNNLVTRLHYNLEGLCSRRDQKCCFHVQNPVFSAAYQL